jgi:L-asparaginase
MQITFIQTGGTIDKDYPKTQKGWAFEIDEPAVKRILELMQPSFAYEIITAFRKDSLEITDEDRVILQEICQKNKNDKIIITHGTDTLLETAQFLAQNSKKTIILTGAMRPERFSNSDAAFNLGMAIAGVQTLAAGVYACMYGLILPYNLMTRDVEGRFVAKK